MFKIIFKVSLLFLFIFSFSLSNAQTTPTHKELKKFKRGNFEYLTGLYKGVLIKRTRHRQIEYDPTIHSKAVLKIKWVSDNEYWLTFISDTQPISNEAKKVVLKVKILSVNGDTYTCHWDCDKCGQGGNDSFKKLK